MSIYVVDPKHVDYDQVHKLVRCKLFADAKTDWEEESIVIEDMPVGYDLWAGSMCATASGDLGILDSEGVWNWLGDDPGDLAKSIVKELQKEKG